MENVTREAVSLKYGCQERIPRDIEIDPLTMFVLDLNEVVIIGGILT